jgi:hypothetical protein
MAPNGKPSDLGMSTHLTGPLVAAGPIPSSPYRGVEGRTRGTGRAGMPAPGPNSPARKGRGRSLGAGTRSPTCATGRVRERQHTESHPVKCRRQHLLCPINRPPLRSVCTTSSNAMWRRCLQATPVCQTVCQTESTCFGTAERSRQWSQGETSSHQVYNFPAC